MGNLLKKRGSLKGSNRYLNYCKGKKVLPAIFGATLVLLAFGPILPQAQTSEGVKAYEMHIDKAMMEDLVIEGPVEYNGVMMTRITADTATLENFVQYLEGSEIISPLAEIQGLEVYCTYVCGTADVEGMVTTMEWNGTEEPPWLLEMLDDPAEMWDVTMNIVYQNVGSVTFSSLDMAPRGSFKVRAEKMEMNIGLMDLLLGMLEDPLAMLSMEMLTPSRNVVMIEGTMEVPYGDETVIISFDESRLGVGDMTLGTFDALGMIIENPMQMLPGIMFGKRIVLSDVTLDSSYLHSEGVTLTNMEQYVD